MIVDPARFPALSEYLGTLPAGMDSYPDCQAKGSMVVSALEGHDLSAELDALPPVLVELVRDPPPPTRWIPLVWSEALFHVVCDSFYPGEEAVIAWTYRRTVAMARKPMYRRLASAAGPRFFLRLGAGVHQLFERGTSMKVSSGDRRTRVRLTHPRHVHSTLNKVSNIGMFRAIIEITGGKNGVCTMTQCTPTGAAYDCSWD